MKQVCAEKTIDVGTEEGSLRLIRVKQATFAKLTATLATVNGKDFGKKVRADEVLSLALSLVGDIQIRQLQDGSLSNQDRFEELYRDYVEKKGAITKDAFLGLVLSGKVSRGKN